MINRSNNLKTSNGATQRWKMNKNCQNMVGLNWCEVVHAEFNCYKIVLVAFEWFCLGMTLFGSHIEQTKQCQTQMDEGNVIVDGWVDGWRVSCIQIASSISLHFMNHRRRN